MLAADSDWPVFLASGWNVLYTFFLQINKDYTFYKVTVVTLVGQSKFLKKFCSEILKAFQIDLKACLFLSLWQGHALNTNVKPCSWSAESRDTGMHSSTVSTTNNNWNQLWKKVLYKQAIALIQKTKPSGRRENHLWGTYPRSYDPSNLPSATLVQECGKGPYRIQDLLRSRYRRSWTGGSCQWQVCYDQVLGISCRYSRNQASSKGTNCHFLKNPTGWASGLALSSCHLKISPVESPVTHHWLHYYYISWDLLQL